VRREIALQGCANFRDLGGYEADGGIVRWRRLFRSDSLDELTPADVAVLREEFGVTTVVDLRSDYERSVAVDHPMAGTGAELLTAPVIDELNGSIMADSSLTLAERYVRLIESGGRAVATTVTAIATSPGAVVFHCAAGKDRTGMVSAIVLGTVGVSDSDVIADYVMTDRNLAGIDERLRRHPAYADTYRYVPQDAMTADAETMRELIAELRARHGSMAGLLRGLGVTDETLDLLVRTLVVPSG
jgi:protein-tyrosine phosphatase